MQDSCIISSCNTQQAPSILQYIHKKISNSYRCNTSATKKTIEKKKINDHKEQLDTFVLIYVQFTFRKYSALM